MTDTPIIKCQYWSAKIIGPYLGNKRQAHEFAIAPVSHKELAEIKRPLKALILEVEVQDIEIKRSVLRKGATHSHLPLGEGVLLLGYRKRVKLHGSLPCVAGELSVLAD